MQIQERKIQYLSEDHIFSFQDTLSEEISFKMFVQCITDKFVQFQKDILEDFVAEFTTSLKSHPEREMQEIKTLFEESLQILNTKLKQFADKVRDLEKFQLKGVVQLVVDNTLMASMIGETTLMIMREEKVLYTLANGVDERAKIDIFSDFIEGALERGDQILYVGTKIADIIDQYDRKEMERLLGQEESAEAMMNFLEEILTTRIEKEEIGFIITYTLTSEVLRAMAKRNPKTLREGGRRTRAEKMASHTEAYLDAIGERIKSSQSLQKIKKSVAVNRYYVVALFLGLLIVFMITALASQMVKKQDPENQFQTASGVYVEVTLEGIQQAMQEFKSLPSDDNQKSAKYAEIKSQIAYLESKGKWIDDIKPLKEHLEAEYYKGFNIAVINNLTQLAKPIFAINNSELSRLGELHSLQVPQNLMIGGTKGAMINVSSDASRGAVVEYNAGAPLEQCVTSLLKDGLYCYNTTGDIYLVLKSGVTPLSTTDGDFKPNIGGVGTYGRNNLYVFQKSPANLGSSLVTRYRNTAGSQSAYQGGTAYTVEVDSGFSFGSFSSFAIDGDFFGWSNGKPYLFWRPDTAVPKLSYREIGILGGVNQNFSPDTKMITFPDTRYIFLFDKGNQTFTVYDTASIKTNAANKASYKMKYLFSYKFNLPTNPVVDVAVPPASQNRPELYLLTKERVYKVDLFSTIETVSKTGKVPVFM